MTVIAWDGKTLAADGLMSNGRSIMSTHGQKIFRACDYVQEQWTLQNESVLAFGVAGDFGSQSYIVNALNDVMHAEAKYPQEHSFTAVLITDAGNVWLLSKDKGDSTGFLHIVEEQYVAIGCGSDAAKAAMLAGQSALDAVAIAMDCNVYCGGDIQAWTPQHQRGNQWAAAPGEQVHNMLVSDPDQALWQAS